MGEARQAIAALGWNAQWENIFRNCVSHGWLPGRVGVEDKHHYQIFAASGVLLGKITGKFRAQAKVQADYPKVGDWVAFTPQNDGERAQIHAVLPRLTQLARKRQGRETVEQVLVTNVDVAFIVHGLDREINVPLIERFLVMTREGRVKPVVLLNKTDLDSGAERKVSELQSAIADVPVHATCARTGKGLAGMRHYLEPGGTVVFMGASGVGKSSLINRLYGDGIQATAEVREGDAKGCHTTTWREMIVLPGGALVIDTPGMREFHMWLGGDGIHEAFPDIETLALKCRFRNCTHTGEKHCAVSAAVESGEVSQKRFVNFLKLQRELEYLHKANRHQNQRASRRNALLHRREILSEAGLDEID